tara:strand:+ start:228 stop:464 length:237 start_codon:yes stop_codon:yes gene_type:complete
MKLENTFDLNQEVWFLDKNKLYCGVVKKIEMHGLMAVGRIESTFIKYWIDYHELEGAAYIMRYYDDLFDSKKLLLESL